MKIDDEMLERYLDRVMLVADRRGGDAGEVRQELADHLYAKVEGLEATGLSRQSAILSALRKHGKAVTVGYQLREPWRMVDIRARGVARGIIAFGPGAIGVIAVGGWSVGVIALGGCSAGILSLGGLALGLVAWGGLSLGAVAIGGLAVGLLAVGGMAIGVIAQGAQVIAYQALNESFLAPIAGAFRGSRLFGFSLNLYVNILMLPLILIISILMAKEEKRIQITRREDELWFD